MSWLTNIFKSTPVQLHLNSIDVKAAFDLQRVGVQGRAVYPDTDIYSLLTWHRRNELVYACIEKIAQAAIDPVLIAEKRVTDKDEWERDGGHPILRLIHRPNPMMDASSFIAAWLVSLHVAGEFYAEIVRSPLGLPTQLWPLNPAKIFPIASGRVNADAIAAYEFRDGSTKVTIPAEDIFVDRFYDPATPYHGLSPLAVVLGAVDMDAAQTDYVRSFFNNGGVPSGVIKILNRTLTQEQSDSILAKWMRKYGRGSNLRNAPAVLDDNAEYQKVGANLDELESESLRHQAESRICSTFGVPPLLVGAHVGLVHQNNRASAQSTQAEFWANKMSPLFKRLRTVLTWQLLTQFEDEELIHAGKVRLNWDMSQVVALQEDENSRQERARKNFLAGALTLNEFRAQIGASAIDSGDVFYIPTSNTVTNESEVNGEQVITVSEIEAR